MASSSTQTLSHRFGEVAKSLGLVTDKQIEDALARQKSLRAPAGASGYKLRVAEVFFVLNVVNVEKVKQVLSEQRKRRQGDASKALPMEHFGEFKLLQKLGEGGMGAVYKAQETLANRIVALKVLRQNLAGSSGFAERFDREARLAGSLNHPNIVACHSAGTTRGVQYLAMEFVDGDTLKARVKREGGKLPEAEALRIGREVANGLAHAHAKGLVHRDIKPDNILLGRDGAVKISDFGTAKSFMEEDSLSRTGTIVGTPYYISPEQVRADKNIDHRADLYALGGTLYHILTGKVPFDAPTSLDIMRRHLQDELENPADINPELSAGAVQIISKLMAKDPEERYQKASAVAEDIERVLSKKDPMHAALEENKSSIKPRRARRRKASSSPAGCMGMLMLGAALCGLAALGSRLL